MHAEGARPTSGRENKPGAAGERTGQYVVHSENHGYTLFLFALSTLTNEIINPTPSFDVINDLAPIAALAVGAIVLVVDPEIKVRSVAS